MKVSSKSAFDRNQFNIQNTENIETFCSVDDRIRSALISLELDIYNSVYLGKQEKYLVFNYSTVGIGYADDEATAERYLCQLHLFAPLTDDITELTKRIKQLIRNSGFTHPETTNASDEEGRHIVFEFEWAEWWE